MKTFFSKTLISASLLLTALSIDAQTAQPYSTILDGSTNVSILGLSTNTFSANYLTNNHSQVIGEYDYVGFTVSLDGSINSGVPATSTATFRFVQSYDNGATFETTPSLSYTTPPINGTTLVTFGTNFFCPASTHIKMFDVWNTNATAFFTNITAKFDLKSPKRGANTNVTP